MFWTINPIYYCECCHLIKDGKSFAYDLNKWNRVLYVVEWPCCCDLLRFSPWSSWDLTTKNSFLLKFHVERSLAPYIFYMMWLKTIQTKKMYNIKEKQTKRVKKRRREPFFSYPSLWLVSLFFVYIGFLVSCLGWNGQIKRSQSKIRNWIWTLSGGKFLFLFYLLSFYHSFSFLCNKNPSFLTIKKGSNTLLSFETLIIKKKRWQ